MAQEHEFEAKVLLAVEERNQAQKQVLFDKIVARFGRDLSGKTFGLWGLAFKPGTDDMREASSVVLLHALIGAGATVKAYDPIAMNAARRELPARWFESGALTLAEYQYDALDGTDAMILVTEWKPFRHPDFELLKKLLKQLVVFDGRNQYDPAQMHALGIEYHGIGRRS
jgi:UDPglucose 6-dehydrogenase